MKFDKNAKIYSSNRDLRSSNIVIVIIFIGDKQQIAYKN